MCDGCVAETVNLGEVLPHWWVVQATKQSMYMEPEDFALVWSNDPSFIWKTVPELDPVFGIESDLTIEQETAADAWLTKAMAFEKELVGELYDSWELVDAAIKSGWDFQKHGRVHYWLFDRIALTILRGEATDEWKSKISVPGYVLTSRDQEIYKALHR